MSLDPFLLLLHYIWIIPAFLKISFYSFPRGERSASSPALCSDIKTPPDAVNLHQGVLWSL